MTSKTTKLRKTFRTTLQSSKKLLFVGSNTSTFGEKISNEEEILNEIFKILRNFGYYILVKPHPIERKDKYKKFPVEIVT